MCGLRFVSEADGWLRSRERPSDDDGYDDDEAHPSSVHGHSSRHVRIGVFHVCCKVKVSTSKGGLMFQPTLLF